MARILKVKQLQAKKRALVAESDVYRQSLMVEIRNLQLYGARMRQRFTALTSSPLFIFLAPLAGSLLRMRFGSGLPFMRRRGRRRPSLIRTLLISLKLFRRMAPLLGGLLARQMARGQPAAERAEEEAPAANI
jgi:hypothetical protein